MSVGTVVVGAIGIAGVSLLATLVAFRRRLQGATPPASTTEAGITPLPSRPGTYHRGPGLTTAEYLRLQRQWLVRSKGADLDGLGFYSGDRVEVAESLDAERVDALRREFDARFTGPSA